MVMQPVPEDPERFVAADLPDRPDLDDDEDASTAMDWHGEHQLDLGYLQKAPAFAPGAPSPTIATQSPWPGSIITTTRSSSQRQQ